MEIERQREEQLSQEMIEEFDKMMGDAVIENFVEIPEFDEKQTKKWKEDCRIRWENKRTEQEQEGDTLEGKVGGELDEFFETANKSEPEQTKYDINNDLDREEVDWDMDEGEIEDEQDLDWF